jgi:hypothetical protein
LKRTNYLEAVGLILIGFGLYETIYTKAQTTIMAAEFGLTATFDGTRFLAVFLNCVIVAVSLIMLPFHKADAGTEPKSVSDALKQLWHSLLDWRSSIAPIAIGFQFFAIVMALNMFSPQSASALCIGFVFVDFSIFLEKKGWL